MLHGSVTFPGNRVRRRPGRRRGERIEPLSEHAYLDLEELIVTLQLGPGEIVTEQALIDRTGRGRTPLREALLRLSREKLVEILPRKGIIISEIRPAQVRALLQTRAVLDRLLAEAAARHADPVQRAELRRLGAALEQRSARKDLAGFMRLDHAIDDVIETASHNVFAADAVRPLHSHCRRFWFAYRHRGDLVRAASLHRRLTRAVASGSEEDAGTAAVDLVAYLEEFTRATLEHW